MAENVLTLTLKNRGQVNTLHPTGDLVNATSSLSISVKCHQFHIGPTMTADCASEVSFYSRKSLAIPM